MFAYSHIGASQFSKLTGMTLTINLFCSPLIAKSRMGRAAQNPLLKESIIDAGDEDGLSIINRTVSFRGKFSLLIAAVLKQKVKASP